MCFTLLNNVNKCSIRKAMGKVRGIRFTDIEETRIQEFLKKNPLIDFSTLARIAVLSFIREPKLDLNPIAKTKKEKEAAL